MKEINTVGSIKIKSLLHYDNVLGSNKQTITHNVFLKYIGNRIWVDINTSARTIIHETPSDLQPGAYIVDAYKPDFENLKTGDRVNKKHLYKPNKLNKTSNKLFNKNIFYIYV